MQVKPQFCGHTLNHAGINTLFFRSEISSAAAKGKHLSYPGGYLNFSTCFKKKVLLEQKVIKSGNKCHFVEKKTNIIQNVLKMQ